jgi:hypothetical protein
MGVAGYSTLLNESPDEDGECDMGTNPATGLLTLIGWGACGGVGVVDRLVYCGVRFGLLSGDEVGDLLEYVEPGLEMIFDHGLLFVVVGVVLLLVQDETDDAVGDDGPRFEYHVASSCKLTIEIVCCRLYWGFGYSTAGFRHGEFELCCIAAVPKSRSVSWAKRNQRTMEQSAWSVRIQLRVGWLQTLEI